MTEDQANRIKRVNDDIERLQNELERLQTERTRLTCRTEAQHWLYAMLYPKRLDSMTGATCTWGKDDHTILCTYPDGSRLKVFLNHDTTTLELTPTRTKKE